MEEITINQLHVCIIEPSHVQAKIIRTCLSDLEIANITVYESGVEALDAFYSYKPDLVISSMYLPDMTGTDVVLAMRDDDELAGVPFMLVSSETSFAMLEPIRQAGVIAILPKPFNQGDLKNAIFSTLDYINPDKKDMDNVDVDELQVLVVDDSPLARKHIMRVLSNIGVEHIDQAKNGKDAMGKISDKFYDLVVTDYNMPEMDGEMLVKAIRENSQQASIPIIMVTSEGDKQRLAAVQQAGVSGICDKPFEIGNVRNLIKKVLAAA
jgi:two-component system chemotaxis response regulator CheY